MLRLPRFVMLILPLLTALAAPTTFAQDALPSEPVVAAEPEPVAEPQSTPAADPPASAAPVPLASQASDPSRQDTAPNALAPLEQRISQAERERRGQRLGSPIALVVTGASLGTFIGLGALVFGTSLGDVKDHIERGTYDELDDWDLDGDIDDDDLRGNRRMTVALSAVALAHFGLAAFGSWWLNKRLHARQRLDRELGALEFERNSLRLKLDVGVTANGASGQLIASF